MKTKLFKFHTENESDEIKLNKFLEAVEVKQIFAQIISGDGHFWSVLVFYESLNEPETENVPHGNSPPEKSPAGEKSKGSEKPALENISLTPQQENVVNALKR